MKTIKYDSITWLDITNPTKKEIEFLKTQYKFHPIILDELTHLSTRSRVESYKTYLYMTYHLPTYESVTKTCRKTEIDFLITKNAVITVHYEELEPINDFMRMMEGNADFKSRMMENSGKIVYGILQETIGFSMRQLRHIEENIVSLTKDLFAGQEAKMLKEISYAKRDVMDYRIITRPQEIILQSFKEAGINFWGLEMKIFLSDLIGDHLKVLQHLENYCATIESLEATNAQLLNAKTNSVVQKFTVLAFLTVPLVLVISIFNVGAVDKLIDSDIKTFLIICGSVLFITILLLVFFRKKGWF